MADMAFPSAPGGHVAIELIGDKTLLMPYVFDARREMAQFKAYYGIDEKRAAGEWVGFHRAEKRYPDGVMIEMITNGPQDILRISGVRPPKVVTVGEERPEEKPKPYMWIGARVQWEKLTWDDTNWGWGALWYDALGLMVIEPGENGVLTGAGQHWGYSGQNIYLEPKFFNEEPLDLNAQRTEFQNTYGTKREGGVWVPPGRMHFTVAVNSNEEEITFTEHLLRHYDIALHDTDFPIAIATIPHDPDETPEEIAKRAVPPGFESFPPLSLWDQVVVLDPDEGGAEPTSRRKEDRDLLDILEDKTGIIGDAMVLPGEYVVKVVAIGDDCHFDDPATPPYPLNGWDEPMKYFAPLPVEIEVRVGKSPNTFTQRIEVQIPQYTNYFHSMWPFGDWDNVTSGCQPEFERPNNHISAWWQGAILVDVWAGTARVVDYYAPPDVFDTSDPWHPELLPCNLRNRTDTYVFVQPPFSDAAVPDNVATQVTSLLYEIYYPAQNYRTHAQILAAANAIPLVSGQLYSYDIASNVFKAIPWVDKWEDVLRRQSILAGRTFAKILFGAVIADPTLCTTTHAAYTGADMNIYACDPENVQAVLRGTYCEKAFP